MELIWLRDVEQLAVPVALHKRNANYFKIAGLLIEYIFVAAEHPLL